MEENNNILEELKLLDSEILIKTDRSNFYFLPEGFFDDFPNNIKTQIWINSVPNKNLYSVPSSYFENLPEIILDKLWLGNKSISNKNHYSLPDNYFDNLADNILKKISLTQDNVQQELEELSPLISNIPKSNVFSIPAGYFDTLTPLTKSNYKEPVKVISLGSKARRWFSYAAAACITGIMFIGGYFYLQNKKELPVAHVTGQFANKDVQKGLSQLSDAEINNYLNNDNSDIYTGNPNSDNQDVDIKTMLNNTSDDEINNYLLENSDPGDKSSGI